jgi:hypothetical protein
MTGKSGERMFVYDAARAEVRLLRGSRIIRWRYPSAQPDWLSCPKCHAAIEADGREALLDRAGLIPIPRTLPDRYGPKLLEKARRLHEQFWEPRSGPAQPA